MDVALAKDELRREAKAKRAAIPREERLAFGDTLAEIGPELAKAGEARVVASGRQAIR